MELSFALSGAALDSVRLRAHGQFRSCADGRTAFHAYSARGTGGGCVGRESSTLHVELGTFLPVDATDTAQHEMHPEWATLTTETAGRLNETRAGGGRIAAVGTTSLRTLESTTAPAGRIAAFEGNTNIFITPGYRFRTAEVLLTNFHLPRSTLFMLVSAFCGLESMRAAFAAASRERYQFYSYGDACLLFRKPSS